MSDLLPEGFVLDDAPAAPTGSALPDGFVLDDPAPATGTSELATDPGHIRANQVAAERAAKEPNLRNVPGPNGYSADNPPYKDGAYENRKQPPRPAQPEATWLTDLQSGWNNLMSGFAGTSLESGAKNEADTDRAIDAMKRAGTATPEQIAYLELRKKQIQQDQADAAQTLAIGAAKQAQLPPTPESVQRFNNATGWMDALSAFAADPYTISRSTILQSAPASIPSALGGIMGSILGPMGSSMGAGGGSYITELGGAVQEGLQRFGADMNDPASIMQVWSQHKAEISKYAQTRATVVGGADALTAGISSKFAGVNPVDQIIKGNIKRELLGTGIEASGGMAGEAGAQLATEGRINQPGQVLAEGLGEVVPGAVQVAGSTVVQRALKGDRETAPQQPPPQPQQPAPGKGDRIEPQMFPEAQKAPVRPMQSNGYDVSPQTGDPSDDEVLHGAGYTPQQIAEMHPAEKAQEAADARAQGVQPKPLPPAPGTAPLAPGFRPTAPVQQQEAPAAELQQSQQASSPQTEPPAGFVVDQPQPAPINPQQHLAALEQKLEAEREAAEAIHGTRTKLPGIAGVIDEALITPVHSHIDSNTKRQMAAAEQYGRADLADYIASRAEQAATTMGTEPGFPPGHPKYDAIKANLAKRKADAIAGAQELRNRANAIAAKPQAPAPGTAPMAPRVQTALYPPSQADKAFSTFFASKAPITPEALAKASGMPQKDAVKAIQRAALRGSIIQTRQGKWMRAPTRVKPISAMQFIASIGGIQDPTGELAGMDLPKMGPYGPVIRKTGLHPDKVREALVEAGYMRDPGVEAGGQATTTVNDVYALLDNEMRGQKAYQPQDQTRADALDTQAKNDALPPDYQPVHHIAQRFGMETWNKVKTALDTHGLDEGNWSTQELSDAARMVNEGQDPEDALVAAAIRFEDDANDPESQFPEVQEWMRKRDPRATLLFDPPPFPDVEPANAGQENADAESPGGAQPLAGSEGPRVEEAPRSPREEAPVPRQDGGEGQGQQPAPAVEQGADNKPQLVIPGTEPDVKGAIKNAQKAPLKGRKPQQAADEGLFGDSAAQQDFISTPPAKPADDFDSMFDAALDAQFGPKADAADAKKPTSKSPPRTAGQAAASAASNAVKGIDDVVKGLNALFGGNKLSSGFTFDEETYAKALPFFKAGLAHFSAAAADTQEMLKALVAHLAKAMDRAAIENMRPFIRRFTEDVKSGKVTIGTAQEAPVSGNQAPASAEKPSASATLLEDFRHFLASPDGSFATIVEARKFAAERGFEAKPGTPEAKQLDEILEHAIVLAARDVVKASKRHGTEVTFRRLVDLYQRQPNLGVRTSQSMADQAYSTPVPLAFLASQLAGVTAAERVYEPTAGNGALLIEAEPSKVIANELNPSRRDALKAQGFKTTGNDASLDGQAKAINNAFGGVDTVIENPPFGTVPTESGQSKTFTVDGWKTTQIDHAIALTSLKAMRDDGRAVLIVGSVKEGSDKSRSDSYNSKQKREFYWRLYKDYNVTDHFTVSGDLYKRQGAGWPVDVIVIEGRGKSSRGLPAAELPRLYETWDDLKEKLNDAPQADARPNAEGSGVSRPPGGRSSVQDAEGLEAGSTANNPPSQGGGNAPGRPGTDNTGTIPAGRPDGQPANAGEQQSAEPDRSAVSPADSGDGIRDSQPPRTRRERIKQAEDADAPQIAYQPMSSLPSLDTKIPTNMAAAVEESLEALVDKHGDLVPWMEKELGYKPGELGNYLAAEQVDAAALALDNVQKGAAFIIGDQTGIGKGRVVASMLRYAMRKGLTPIFVTEKPNLYGDIMRDLNDIGIAEMLKRDVRPFLTNAGVSVPLDDEAVAWADDAESAKAEGKKPPEKRGKFLRSSTGEAHKKQMRALMQGSKDFDIVFTTYDQMNTIKGQTTDRRVLMSALAGNAFIVLDESHNAGGTEASGWEKEGETPNRSDFLKDITTKAKAVMFSSATYAKRPQTMALYAKTDMGKAVEKPEMLGPLITKGGVPMQQVVASMLAKAGQYIRRERSFDGVSYDVEPVKVDREAYRTVSKSLSTIAKFDKELKDSDVWEQVLEDLKGEGEAAAMDTGTGGISVTSTNFTSLMHNIVAQMLLAIKADAVADRAIASLKAGEKPVITVSSTMGSFLKSFAEENGIARGQDVSLSFRDVLKRYLDRTLRLTVKNPDGTKKHIFIPQSALPGNLQDMFREAERTIASLDTSALPISPIDWLHYRLKKAGYRTAEITGRKDILEYGGPNKASLGERSDSDISPAGRTIAVKKFNAGDIDAMILNRAGSTGLSLHAKKGFKDVRRRRMIIAQAEGNIDTHMQMLGRVHRTGQIIPPAFSQAYAEVPAEARPAAVLAKKMASLNANTTAARKSAFSADDSVDFLNKYGDQVAREFLRENPKISDELDYKVTGAEDQEVARELTGKMALLDIETQQRIIDEISARYKVLIDNLNALGENTLEATTMDLRAKTTSRQEVKAGEGDSPFTQAVQLEEVQIKTQGKALPLEEIIQRASKALTGQEMTLTKPENDLQHLHNIAESKATTFFKKWVDDFQRYENEIVNATKTDETKAKRREELYANRVRFIVLTTHLMPGRRITIASPDGDPITGIVMEVKRRDAGATNGNPLALGAWSAEIAIPTNAQRIIVPFSSVIRDGDPVEQGDRKIRIEPEPTFDNGPEAVVQQFTKARQEGTETRYIVTGNILAGYDQTKGRGQIINYTDDSGNVKPGILMNQEFEPAVFFSERAVRFKTGAQVAEFIGKAADAEINSSDALITVRADGPKFEFELPAGRGTGGQYFLHPKVRTAAGDRFVKVGSKMRHTAPDRAAAVKLLDALMEAGALFQTTSQQDVAEEIVNGPKPAPQAPKQERLSSTQARQTSPNRFRFSISDRQARELTVHIQQTAERILGRHLVGVEVRRTLEADFSAAEDAVFDPNTGLIWVALQGLQDPKTSIRHEAIHALRNAGVFTAQEWAALSRMAQGRWIQQFNIRSRYEQLYRERFALNDAQIEELLAEEAIAEAFAEHLAKSPQDESLPGRIFTRLRRFLEALRSALRGQGFTSVDQLLEDIDTGKVAAREAGQGQKREFLLYGRQGSQKEDITKTEAFRKWFGDSKVVDEQGRPMVMYHATHATFDAFNTKAKSSDQWFGQGSYFAPGTDDLELHIGVSLDDDTNVMPLYLSIKNPYIWPYPTSAKVDADVRAAGVDRSKHEFDGEVLMNEGSEKFTAWAKAQGYDGVLVTGKDGSFSEIVAFHPESIKSVNNRGTFDPNNQSILSSRGYLKPPKNPAPGSFDEPHDERVLRALMDSTDTLLNRIRRAGKAAGVEFVRKLQDREIDLRRTQNAIERASGPISEPQDAYLAASLYPGRVAQRDHNIVEEQIKPLIEDIARRGLTLKDVDDFARAQHAFERNAYIASISKPGSQFHQAGSNPAIVGGSGLSDDQAAAILQDFRNRGKYADAKATADRVVAMNRRTLDNLLREGLIEQDTYDALTTRWKHYVPLRGEDNATSEDHPDNPRVGRRYDVRGKEFQSALGRDTLSDSPLAYSIMQARQANIRIEKNRVGKRLLRLAQANPNEGFWQVNRRDMKRVLDKRLGYVRNVNDIGTTQAENVFAVKVGGKTWHITIHHEGLLKAMKGIGAENMHGLFLAFHKINRLLAGLNTSYDPEFLFRNFVRDLQQAGIVLQEEQRSGLTRKVVADIKNAASGMNRMLQGDYSTQWARYAREYANAGGKMGFMDRNDIVAEKESLEKLMGEVTATGWRKAAQFAKAATFDRLERWNDSLENTLRLSTYVNLRRMGVSQDKAAMAARDLTVNFNRKGEWGPAANSLYLFFNASMQGAANMSIRLARSPRLRKIALGIIAAGFLQGVLNRMIAGDDDDDKNRYDKIPAEVKAKNGIIMLPKWMEDEYGIPYLKWPLPLGYNTFHYLGTEVAEAVSGNHSPLESAGNILGSIAENFNPLGQGGSLTNFFAPTLLDPLVDIETNKDWFGEDIVPKTYDEKQPWAQRYAPNMNWMFKGITDTLSQFTGGTPERPGAIDWSPEWVEHIWDFAAGGVGRLVNRAATTAQTLTSGEDIDPNKVPFVRVFTGQGAKFEDRDTYYEIRDAVEITEKELKARIAEKNPEAADRVRQNYSRELKMVATIKAAEKQLAKLRKQFKAAKNMENLSDEARKKRLDFLSGRMDEIQLKVRKRWNDLGKTPEPTPAN